jgi:hypothetical protein
VNAQIGADPGPAFEALGKHRFFKETFNHR